MPSPAVRAGHLLAAVAGGTMGMEEQSVVLDPEGHHQLQPGTGGLYKSGGGLAPGRMLSNVLNVVPELRCFAQLDLKVAFNKDSSNVGPSDW
jgi:hypothetical protein